jgi:hypothetical protein
MGALLDRLLGDPLLSFELAAAGVAGVVVRRHDEESAAT